jgi:hypothetical protein
MTFKYNVQYIVAEMSDSNPSSDLADGYVCKICGLAFVTPQALAAHIDSEHPEAEQPEVL